MSKSVEKYLLERIKKEGTIHMTLLDPEKIGSRDCMEVALEAEKGGTAAIMVGGSTLFSNAILNEAVKDIKSAVNVPVILFPNNITGVSPHADAIWFMSLLNSTNTYYLIEVQALTVRLIKSYGLETISLGYIVVGEGGAVGFIGHARPIAYNHPEIALGYGLAGETLGMHFIYLEAGSGAEKNVPREMVNLVKSQLTVPLIVGGGIRDGAVAREMAASGADIIVTGTLVEEDIEVRERIYDIVTNIKSIRR